MAIPDFQSIFLPLLKILGDKKEHALRECIDRLTDDFKLTDEERKQLLPSGQQLLFDNRVGWARTYLKKASLIDSTKRGFVKITERGIKLLSQPPSRLDVKFLKQYPEFSDFHAAKKREDVPGTTEVIENADERTPEEIIESGHQQIKTNLSKELLEQIKQCSPSFFERLVIDVLIKMGYGGSRHDAGEAIGKVGDEGIDGIIKEDKLGLDIIYIQAKRWDGSVSRPEIQKFVGALQGKRAKKGIFITTSYFTREAYEYADNIDCKIVLIDGQKLTDLMIENQIGCSKIRSYEINKIDSDYFTDE